MLNILVNAYAVAPNWGSEQGMAWNWIVGIARYHNVFIITEGEWRKEIDSEVSNHPLRDNLHFYYIPVSGNIRRMCWNQGDWRFYYYYHQWQKKALALAREICRNEHIDITHQLNMIGFREPGLMWKISGVKHVWGPIGSMGAVPTRFLYDSPISVRVKTTVKNLITSYQIKHGIVKKAILNSDYLVAALNITRDRILSCYGKNAEVIGETGLVPNVGFHHKECFNRPIELLWVGRFIPTKKLSIALQTLALVENKLDFRLHIVGSGTEKENYFYRKLANNLGINSICTFYGKLPNDRVLQLMRETDLLFFTSVHEGGPHVVLEAIANNLPILCFDTCGQGTAVDETIGIKVPLTTLEEGIKGFAKQLDYLNQNRELIRKFSINCTQKQQELSWDSKVERMCEIYEQVVQ